MKKAIVCVAVLLLWLPVIFAQNQDWHQRTPKRDLEKAIKAYKNGLYREAYFLLDGIKDEKVFNLEAEMMMGVLCDYGYETLANPARAARYYKDAAAAGMAEAQNNLGVLYYSGRGVAQSYTEAARLFQQAADQKYIKAYHNLGNVFFWGQGVEKNYESALRYFTLAADGGNETARFSEGYMYESGFGTSKDLDKAIKLYLKAGNKGEANAQNKLGELYEKGTGVKQDIAEAVNWYQKAADKSLAAAQYNLGRLYREGNGVVPNDYTASDLFKKAATNGNVAAMLVYANEWETGKGAWSPDKGSTTNPAVAVTWYLKAANAGSEEALAALKRLGYSAKGASLIARNAAEEIAAGMAAYSESEAATCFRQLYNYRLAPEFSVNAMMYLAGLYERGEGCEKDDGEARNWYFKAANLGNDPAIYRVARMYEEGTNGLAVNQAEATRLYRLASSHGFTAATEKLNPQGYNNSDNSQSSKYTPTICSCCHGSGTQTVWQGKWYQVKDQYGREKGSATQYIEVPCSCCKGARVR